MQINMLFVTQASPSDDYWQAGEIVVRGGGPSACYNCGPATVTIFPGMSEDATDRWGFVGHEAPEDVAKLYLPRRLPERMKKRGAANPVRYSP